MRSIIKYIDEALFSSASEFSKADDTDELEFVDLGLSVDWAKCNLGAKEETDYGHYYMWASTKPNDNDKCCWENTPFNNGNERFDENYFNSVKNKVCRKCVLSSEYDAAYQKSNGDYRMPTKKEFDELINNTNHEWIKNYNNTNVNGMKFTNKHDNSKFIFIPAAGGRWESSTDSIYTDAYVWSASLYCNFKGCAWYLGFSSSYIDNYVSDRKGGFPVRPVQEK